MAANPITYTEFQAFCWARADLRPTAWEIDAFMQLDTHVLEATHNKRTLASKGKAAKGGDVAPVSVKDRGGVRNFMRTLMAKKNGGEGKK